MKKILIMVLAVACAFTMFSCSCNDNNGNKVSVADFTTAIDATAPKTITVDTKLATVNGDLNSKATTTFNDDGSFTLVYSYEQFNTSTEGQSGELKKTITTTVTCDKDGNYSDGGALVGATTAATGHKLNLDSSKMTYKVSSNGDILTATVKADNTQAVFGIAFGADVTLILSKNAGKITSFTLSYATASGNVETVCDYN